MDIFSMVIAFMMIMADKGYVCQIEEIMEKTAIVECHTEHFSVTELLDIRKNQNVLISYGRIL